MVQLTFRNGKKSDNDNCIFMAPAGGIMNVSDRHIEWVVLIVASCDRHSGLIASQDDRNKSGSVRCWIRSYFVLDNSL
jgi:hypothetical protein